MVIINIILSHGLQAGKRVILFSYGSGSSATMFSLQLREGQHPFSLSNIANVMDVARKLKSRHEVFLVFFFSDAINFQVSLFDVLSF